MPVVSKIEYLNTSTSGRIPEATKRPAHPLEKVVRFGFGVFGRIFPTLCGHIAFRLFSTPRIRARHSVSDRILESAGIFELLYGKILIKGYEWGKGDKVVLLVHGWESRGTALRSFVPQLVQRGYRVVAFDGPAHGNSGGRSTNIVAFSHVVRALIQRIGDVEAIITHSFGGAAVAYAMNRIDRSLSTEKLVMISAPASLEFIYRDAVKIMNLPPPAARVFRRKIESVVETAIDSLDLSAIGSEINVGDTLIVHDKDDTLVPFHFAEKIFEKWENASLLVTEGLGHYRLIKNQELIERVVRFIREDIH